MPVDRGSATTTRSRPCAGRCWRREQLGSHNGLPVTMVISTTLKELESGRGHAVTGGGSLLPMSEVIRQAAARPPLPGGVRQPHRVPAVSGARPTPGVRRRSGLCCIPRSVAVRFPAVPRRPITARSTTRRADWADGGQTDIADETLACGRDNRRVKPGGWRTRKRKDGRTEWIPPPQLDWGHLPLAGDGQARVNNYHHPERYLTADDGPISSDLPEG